MTHRDPLAGITLLLVRHGRCLDSAAGLIARRSSALSAEGRSQLYRLAESWNGHPPNRLFASDLVRARESAEMLGSAWRRPVEFDSRLAEASFGTWEGSTWNDVARNDRSAYREWASEWATASPPQGESLAELCKRVEVWITTLIDHGEFGSTVVAVTHAGVVRAALITMIDISPSVALQFAIGPGSVTSLLIGRAAGGRWCEVGYVNRASFAC